MGSHKKTRRSSTSSSDSSSDESSKKQAKHNRSESASKKILKRKHVTSSSSDSSSSGTSSTSSSSDSEEERRLRKQKKLKILNKKNKKQEEDASTDIPLDLMTKSKAMAPMTKEEWEKRQSVVRRVYDESSGRHRLIKGDGEVIEEIVSRDRHKAINQQATKGDGDYFQAQTAGRSKK